MKRLAAAVTLALALAASPALAKDYGDIAAEWVRACADRLGGLSLETAQACGAQWNAAIVPVRRHRHHREEAPAYSCFPSTGGSTVCYPH